MNYVLYNYLRKLTASSTIKVVLTPRGLVKAAGQMIVIESGKNVEPRSLTVAQTKIRKLSN